LIEYRGEGAEPTEGREERRKAKKGESFWRSRIYTKLEISQLRSADLEEGLSAPYKLVSTPSRASTSMAIIQLVNEEYSDKPIFQLPTVDAPSIR